MVNRLTVYNNFILYVTKNIEILRTKKEYYDNSLTIANNKLSIYKDSLERNSKEFYSVYSISLEKIDSSYNIVLYNNKVNLNKQTYINETVSKLTKLDKSYDKYIIALIKTITENYFNTLKEIKEINRYIQLIGDKLEFLERYKNLSRNVIFYILTQCNNFYQHEILRGESVHLGHHIGFIKVTPKNVSGKINFIESFKYKELLIKEGKIPYNKKDALRAKKAGKEYNGVKWFVYYENDIQHYINWYCYSLKLPNKDYYSFNPTKYNNTGLTVDKLAKKYTTIESMRKLKLGIVNKLSLLLDTNEMQFVKYMKDDLQFSESR